MKENVTFYYCATCGNIVGLIDGNIDHMNCCGKPLQKLVANSVDASVEKHVPTYEMVEDEIVVSVGEVKHPMEKDHYIMWLAQVTENVTTRVKLYPEQDIEVRFKYIPGSTIYAYCNKHGLWKKDVK